MNYTTVNSTAESSENSTTHSFGLVYSLYIFVYTFAFLFGFPTHCYVIWLIVTGAGSGVASEIFILNLSVAECGYSVNCLVFVLSLWLSRIEGFKDFLMGLISTGRPLFQSVICVERYLAVVHPVTFLKSKPLRYRLICSTVAWIFTLVSCFCHTFIIGSLSLSHIWLLSVQFIFFFSIQVFCLVAVLRALKQSGPGDRRREEENHMKRRAFTVIKITIVSMVVTYITFNIPGFYTIIIGQNNPADWLVGVTCYVLCGFLQPVLYLHRTGKLPCPRLF